MKNTYVTPEVEVIVLDSTDLLTTSPAAPTSGLSTPLIDMEDGFDC